MIRSELLEPFWFLVVTSVLNQELIAVERRCFYPFYKVFFSWRNYEQITVRSCRNYRKNTVKRTLRFFKIFWPPFCSYSIDWIWWNMFRSIMRSIIFEKSMTNWRKKMFFPRGTKTFIQHLSNNILFHRDAEHVSQTFSWFFTTCIKKCNLVSATAVVPY